jgi:hypothetical protein
MGKVSYPKRRKRPPLRTFAKINARMRDTSATIEARALWFLIDTFADAHGERAFPSVATLAKLMGRGRNQVFKYLKELESLNWIARNHSFGQSNSYVILYPYPVPESGTTPVPKSGTLTNTI